MVGQEVLDRAVLLHKGKQSLIYKAHLTAYGGEVIVKVLREEGQEGPAAEQLLNEYNLLRQLNGAGARAVLDKIDLNNFNALILAYAEGSTLSAYCREYSMTLSEKLQIAIRLCQLLDLVHQNNIIHANLSSENIIVQPGTLLLTLIDFGISAVSPVKVIDEAMIAAVDLPYMAPELSGKLSTHIDERADLYSLGVVLYELFGGCLPFKASSTPEYVHAHMALVPELLHEKHSKLPEMIGEIVQKLLAKIPEDRYHAAAGVQADLEQCLEQLEKNGYIDAFTLGIHDHISRLRFSQRLFGREAEFKKLHGVWQNVCTGAAEVVWIKGPAGVGKSALANQVQAWTRFSWGYFACGKFDSLLNKRPYHAITQALEELIDHWLTKSQEEVVFWRFRIQHALGKEGRLITDLIPRLELLIGPQPELPQLEGPETQNRFVYTFRNFLSALACEEHPLVLHLEDLHWADSATIHLLEEVFEGSGFVNLLLLCTFRSDEVGEGHLLHTLLNKPSTGFHQHHIALHNLHAADISQFLAESFHCSEAEVSSLAELLYAKTSGNPLFLRQFLQSVTEANLLYFSYSKADSDGGSWEWDMEGIEELPQTENVLSLLSSRIKMLDAEVQTLLQTAASIGGQFSRRFLFNMLQWEEQVARAALAVAVREGFLVQLPFAAGAAEARKHFRFAHDRLQQAAYLTLTEQEKLPIHLLIGRSFKKLLKQEEGQQFLFDAVMHLNLARELLIAKEERLELARLNYRAGKKAMDAAGYTLALELLQEGSGLLPADCWESEYDFTLSLISEAAFAAYLSGDFNAMDAYIEEVVANARQTLDKSKVLDTKVQALIARNQGAAAVETALNTLHELGVKFPRKPSKAAIVASLLKTELMLRRKGIDKLASLPKMTDPHALAAMNIMASVGAAVSRSAPELFPIHVCKLVQMSLKWGNAQASIPAYSGYGILQTALFNKVKTGYSYGQLAIELMDKLDAHAIAAKTHIISAAFLDFWINHLSNSIDIAGRAYELGLEGGDKEFAASGLMVQCIHGFLAGEPLPQLAKRMESHSGNIRHLKQELLYQQTQMFHQAVIMLMQEEELTDKLKGRVFDEEEALTEEFKESSKAGVFYLQMLKLILCYFAGNYNKAQEYSDLLADKKEHVMATAVLPVYVFYDALLQAALCDTLLGSKRKLAMARLSKGIASMKKWARHAPMNYLHKYKLLQAEWHRLEGNDLKARIHYENAAQGAHEQAYLQEKALTYELTAKFLFGQGNKETAGSYLLKAYKTYLYWGAKAKAKQLMEAYPLLHTQHNAAATEEAASAPATPQALDITSMLDAATVLSSDMQLHKMLENLLKIVIQQAGAQEGYLLLNTDEQLEVVAHYLAGQPEVELLPNIPLHEYTEVPAAIINYTYRTQEEVVLPDAQTDKRFSSDAVVAIRFIRSAISIPIVRQGRLLGIIYLHNTLATGAFSARQLQMLRLLSGQIAVSLENAMLYTQMEQKVEERTQQLKQQQSILQQKNAELYALNEEKDDLVNIVAHDLRSPLNQIRGMLNLIMMAPTNLTDDQKQFISLSLSSAERLSGMIARILDLNALENQSVHLKLEMIELDELLDEVVTNFKIQAADKDIVLQLLLPEDPIHIELDKNYTMQILENLISNALKFSPPDATVQVVLYTDEDVARIEVTDEGPGISNKDLKRLFSKFQTLTARPTAGEDSTGLGLSIAKRYVEAMGGHIGCHSEMGEGSTFFVEFVLV